MGRVAKKAPAAAVKEVEDSPTQTITQTRTRRTPKPNPKYTNESIVILPKLELSDTPGSSDAEDKQLDVKIVKSVKKVTETPASLKANKASVAKNKAALIKKQKLDYDDDMGDEKLSEDEKPTPTRATRSGKGGVDSKDTLKVGDDSVAIVDVSSIISKASTKPDSPKVLRAGVRKRAVPEESPKDDQAKKKKEDEKPSLITARKSYMPPSQMKKTELKNSPKPEAEVEIESDESTEEQKETLKTPATTRARRNAGASAESPQSEPAEKKMKVEEVKVVESKTEVKKLSVVRRNEQITRLPPPERLPVGTLPVKTLSNSNSTLASSPRPIPRILNSMITPKGKNSPNVKLAGDGTDKKVFSIDLTDDSIKEKKIIASPVKASAMRPSAAVKENVANNKALPATLLQDKLESELMRMKASAIATRRIAATSHISNRQVQSPVNNINSTGARRITKFESWYVIDVKNMEPLPFRHTHSHSLINVGNNIKDLQLPSSKWDYKVTLQRRFQRKENNNEEEVYTGDVNDKSIEADKANYEPVSILFKRTHRESNKISIDRSLMLKQNMFTITMNGKQCKLLGAPDNINSLEDLETLLSIIDSCSLHHSCIELVTNNDVMTIT